MRHLLTVIAVLLAFACCTTEADRNRMRAELDSINQRNRNDQPFTAADVQPYVDFFDDHGTPNDRLLAHYLLGRTYLDHGEAPMALQCYQDALDCADTTAKDFDFYTLSSAYSQMATLYHSQLLLTNEIEARKKASYYALRAKQIKWSLYDQVMSAGAYMLLNKQDSAEIILKSALKQYREKGYIQEALLYSRLLIHLYIQQSNKLAEAKTLMDQFETESDLFDENHELPPSQRQYFDYKGRYFEGIHQFDSAEYYYRKIYHDGMPYISQDPMYRGLLSVFSKRHLADSVAKYAQLYCMVNDSSIALKDRDQIARMTAFYNYNRLQKEAHENEVKVYRIFIGLIIVLVAVGIAIIAAFLGYRHYQNKIKKLKTELADATEEYEENLHQLQLLEKTHQAVIGNIQEELDQAQGESSALRDKFAHAQQTISEINQEYEAEKAQLLETNEALNKKIEELQKNTAISKHMELSESFKKEMIVTQILTLADKRKGLVKEKYWDELTKVFGNSFPALYKDLCLYCNTPQNIRVCILTILSVSNDEQAILLDTTKQRVSNVKSDLNRLLFNESTSKTLRKNLIVRYNLYGLERDSKSKRNPM